jgi:Spy/CpxP family protein refolding chaperone
MIRKLFIATLILCGVALAQPPQGALGIRSDPEFGGPHRHFGPPSDREGPGLWWRWWKNAEVVKTIGLSDAQVQKIEQIFLDSRVKLVDIHATLQKEEIRLEPLLQADNPDESAVMGAIDRIAAARADLEKANARMAFAIRRVLTPEQWKQLRALRPRRGDFPPPMDRPHSGMHHNRHRLVPPPDASAPPPPESGAPPAESK